MSKRNKILIGVGLTLVLTVVIVLNIRGKKEDAVEVQTEKVKRGDVIKTVSASGKIQPVTDIKISSNVSAKILQLTVKEGDKVKRGQVLVSLDRTFYDAQLDQAKAELLRAKSQVATAQANYEKAQQDFSRVKDLTAKQLASASELEVAQTTLSTTRASVESAESQVQAAEASA
ncbi:MAG TPA: biotin/lipoyl-binding protein, partial [bacterium]|nr:biotin/lipoyl-binding protein [bacterium]